MKCYLFEPLILIFIISCSFLSYGQSDPNARDLRILTEWFEGEFDNDAQLWLEGRRDWKGNPDEKHSRLHVVHKKIIASDVGEHVFYIEEYIDNDPRSIVRQRVVSFESIPTSDEIVMKIFFLQDAERFQLDSNRLVDTQLELKELYALNGCDVIFKRSGEQYHGSMRSKACRLGEGELARYSVHDMVVSQNQYWRVDQTYLFSNDQHYKGHPNDEPYKLRRATNYTCDVSFHEKAYYIPSDKDKKYKGAVIHNQGGMQWFDNPIDGKKYGVQLREKEYPFYNEGSDFLMLRFIEEGAVASTAIITTSPRTPSISFQIGWASAHCKMISN